MTEAAIRIGPWQVDLAAGTVSHPEGWIFSLAQSEEDPNAYSCWCSAVPENTSLAPLLRVQRQQALRVEAGQAYLSALL